MSDGIRFRASKVVLSNGTPLVELLPAQYNQILESSATSKLNVACMLNACARLPSRFPTRVTNIVKITNNPVCSMTFELNDSYIHYTSSVEMDFMKYSPHDVIDIIPS